MPDFPCGVGVFSSRVDAVCPEVEMRVKQAASARALLVLGVFAWFLGRGMCLDGGFPSCTQAPFALAPRAEIPDLDPAKGIQEGTGVA